MWQGFFNAEMGFCMLLLYFEVGRRVSVSYAAQITELRTVRVWVSQYVIMIQKMSKTPIGINIAKYCETSGRRAVSKHWAR